MNKRILPEECKLINQFIEELGGITDAQLDLLLGTKKKNKEFYINVLKTKHIKEKSPGVYVSKFFQDKKIVFTKEMEYCVWVLLYNMKNKDDTEVFYSRTEKPAQLAFLKDDILYKAAYIDKNSEGKLITLYQQYIQNFLNSNLSKQPGEKSPFHYIFVISNESVLDLIGRIDMDAPYTIAYVKQNSDGFPIVEYYN